LGGARLALDAWQRGEQPSTPARRRFAHPEPRINAGRWLAEHDAHAMIDLSDGIGGDACHLAAASAVALDIDLEKLPTVSGVVAEAERVGIPPGQYAAEAGEDYELLVALPASFDSQSAFTRECGIELTRIGTIMKGKRVRFLSEGREVEPKGFAHFG
jgi:thiamine-monophosphate kinase